MIDFEPHDLARDLLATDLPRRWQHVQAVADRATLFRRAYPTELSAVLVTAALLHDIGYAPAISHTGFHPIDGARYLRQQGVDERIVNLVAQHTCACIEASFHDLDHVLMREFPRIDSLPHDALLFCDLTTGPTGEPLSIDERLTDIRVRYGQGHLVTRFIDRAEPELRAAVARAEMLLRPTLITV